MYVCIIDNIDINKMVDLYVPYFDNENKNENKNQIDQWDFVSDKEFNK